MTQTTTPSDAMTAGNPLRGGSILHPAALAVILSIFSAVPSAPAAAQFRQDLMAPPASVTAQIHRTQGSGRVGDWLNMIPMTMSHSYSMSFGTFGGRYQNLNAYTNHTQFRFSDRLQANFDLAVLHSPFGGSVLQRSDSPMGARIMIQNASLTYRLSENAWLDVRFSQSPYGMGGWGHGGYGGYGGYGGGFHGLGLPYDSRGMADPRPGIRP